MGCNFVENKDGLFLAVGNELVYLRPVKNGPVAQLNRATAF